MARRRTLHRVLAGSQQELGSNWYATIGQDGSTQSLWEFSVWHREILVLRKGRFSKCINYIGFLTQSDAEKALAQFLEHEVVICSPYYQRTGGKQGGAIETVDVGYRFASKTWIFRVGYRAVKRTNDWYSYYMGAYNTRVEAMVAGFNYWDLLRLSGRGGADSDPKWQEG